MDNAVLTAADRERVARRALELSQCGSNRSPRLDGRQRADAFHARNLESKRRIFRRGNLRARDRRRSNGRRTNQPLEDDALARRRHACRCARRLRAARSAAAERFLQACLRRRPTQPSTKPPRVPEPACARRCAKRSFAKPNVRGIGRPGSRRRRRRHYRRQYVGRTRLVRRNRRIGEREDERAPTRPDSEKPTRRRRRRSIDASGVARVAADKARASAATDRGRSGRMDRDPRAGRLRRNARLPVRPLFGAVVRRRIVVLQRRTRSSILFGERYRLTTTTRIRLRPECRSTSKAARRSV